VIEVRIEQAAASTGRCVFCWQRLDVPKVVQAVVYEDGERFGRLACAEPRAR
jgi:hypothetical protein